MGVGVSGSESESQTKETLKFEKPLLETECLRLDFQGFHLALIATSYTRGNRVLDTRFPCECHVAIKPHQIIQTEPQRLDLQSQNRVFEARFVKNGYSLKTGPTN